MALLIQFDQYKGDVTDKAYMGYSRLDSYDLPGISNAAQNQMGKADYHRGHAADFAPIQIIKPVDSISPYLLSAACNGKVFKEVTLVNTGSGDNNGAPYLKITLKNVRVAHYGESHHDQASHPREMVSLTYSSVTRALQGKDVTGRVKAPLVSGFDLEQIKAL